MRQARGSEAKGHGVRNHDAALHATQVRLHAHRNGSIVCRHRSLSGVLYSTSACCEEGRRCGTRASANQPRHFVPPKTTMFDSAVGRSQAKTRLNKKLDVELQGTPPSDLTGKTTKWVAGSAGGPVIGVESSGLSPSEAQRGWTLPATRCNCD